MNFKQKLAMGLRRMPLLRWGLRLGVWLFAPRQPVGVAGVIFNRAGQVLLVEHVFRPYHPWGLPGGWIERGENPAEAIQRELKEELALDIEVKQLLLCEVQGGVADSAAPLGLGLAFYCRLVDEANALRPGQIQAAETAYEILGMEWVDPNRVNRPLIPLDQKALRLGQIAFNHDHP